MAVLDAIMSDVWGYSAQLSALNFVKIDSMLSSAACMLALCQNPVFEHGCMP